VSILPGHVPIGADDNSRLKVIDDHRFNARFERRINSKTIAERWSVGSICCRDAENSEEKRSNKTPAHTYGSKRCDNICAFYMTRANVHASIAGNINYDSLEFVEWCDKPRFGRKMLR
jgi:hypothetical protein